MKSNPPNFAMICSVPPIHIHIAHLSPNVPSQILILLPNALCQQSRKVPNFEVA